MKMNRLNPSAMAGLALAFSFALASAQEFIINTFDSVAETNNWRWETGSSIAGTVDFDATKDAGGTGAAGSLKVAMAFTNALDGQGIFTRDLTPLDATPYGRIVMDVRVDPASGMSGNAYGWFGVVARNNASYDWIELGGQTLPSAASNHWIHIELPLTNGLTNLRAVTFKLWGGGPPSLPSTVTLYLDNVKLQAGRPDLIVGAFNYDLEGWAYAFGRSATMVWDPNMDANGSTNSGSMYVTASWLNLTNTWQDSDLQKWNINFVPTNYARIAYDIKVDTNNSTLSGDGNYEGAELVLRGTDINWTDIAQSPPLTNGNWVHVEVPLLPPLPAYNLGMNFRFQPNPSGNYRGPISYWVDNIKVLAVAPPEPPPTLGLGGAGQGLELIASGPGQYQRQGIRTTDGAYSWVGSGGTVNYSMNILKGLPSGTPNMFAYLFVIGTDNYAPGPEADWDEPSGIFLSIGQQSNGLAAATLQYKTNAPGSHGIRFTTNGTLAVITNLPMVGTWTLSLNQNNWTLSTPSGATTNVTVSTDVLQYFDPNGFYPYTFAYFGVQPGDLTYRYRSVMLARAQISGLGVPSLDQDFTTQASLDPVFTVAADDPTGIQPHPTNTVYALWWNAPATGFNLKSSSSLSTPAANWPGVGLPAVPVGARKMTFLPNTALPSVGAGFFLLKKP